MALHLRKTVAWDTLGVKVQWWSCAYSYLIFSTPDTNHKYIHKVLSVHCSELSLSIISLSFHILETQIPETGWIEFNETSTCNNIADIKLI